MYLLPSVVRTQSFNASDFYHNLKCGKSALEATYYKQESITRSIQLCCFYYRGEG